MIPFGVAKKAVAASCVGSFAFPVDGTNGWLFHGATLILGSTEWRHLSRARRAARTKRLGRGRETFFRLSKSDIARHTYFLIGS